MSGSRISDPPWLPPHSIHHRWHGYRQLMLTAAAALAGAALIFLVVREIRRTDVEIAAISVPAKLAERGLTPEVVAQRLVDQMEATANAARAETSERPPTELAGTQPDINVPLTGVSLRSIAAVLRNVLGIRARRVSGEIILQPDDMLSMRLRMSGVGRISDVDAVPVTDVDKLLAAAAPDIWRVTAPQLYAWYVADHEPRPEEVRRKLADLHDPGAGAAALANTVDFLMARADVRAGQAREALAVTDTLTQRAPEYAPGWYARALALADLNRPSDALAASGKAMALDAGSTWAHKSAARVLLATNHAKDALAEIEAARKLDPTDTDLPILQATAMNATGQGDAAVGMLQQTVARDPAQIGAQQALGDLMLAHNNIDGALQAYDAALAQNPGLVGARIGRARALLASRHSDAALAETDALLRAAPTLLPAQVLRGNALLGLGRNDEALALFDGVLKQRPDAPLPLRGRALALAALGQHDAAIPALQRAIDANPNDRRLRAELARLQPK